MFCEYLEIDSSCNVDLLDNGSVYLPQTKQSISLSDFCKSFEGDYFVKHLGRIGSIGLVTRGPKVSAGQLLVRLKEYRKLEAIHLNELPFRNKPFRNKLEYRIVSLYLKYGSYKILYSLQKQARKRLMVLLKCYRKQTGA